MSTGVVERFWVGFGVTDRLFDTGVVLPGVEVELFEEIRAGVVGVGVFRPVGGAGAGRALTVFVDDVVDDNLEPIVEAA